MLDKEKIMILCKVVDNFGDIGAAFRLAKALSALRENLRLTLVVSDLAAFHAMAKEIDPEKALQTFRYKSSLWKVSRWDNPLDESEIPDIILECFQCGRPEWLENALFSDAFTRTVQIINIDYLTAEDYAEEFHLLKSGTRKSGIKKIFFMPGFTGKTGGLITNDAGMSAKASKLIQSDARSDFRILFFAYEGDCSPIVRALDDFQETMRKKRGGFSLSVFLAAGKSQGPFLEAWEKSGRSFRTERIPFLEQDDFDSLIMRMDFLFVRGEDSLARAALSSIPFVWQAYRQDENYQLVKVDALLERMRVFFDDGTFAPIRAFWRSYNDSESETKSGELSRMLVASAEGKDRKGFADFSEALRGNGNLAEHLLAFIGKL